MPDGIARNVFPWELKAEKLLERLRPDKLPTRRRQLPSCKSLASWAPQKNLPKILSGWRVMRGHPLFLISVAHAVLLQWTADKIFLPVYYSLDTPRVGWSTLNLFWPWNYLSTASWGLHRSRASWGESHCPLETIASIGVSLLNFQGWKMIRWDDEMMRRWDHRLTFREREVKIEIFCFYFCLFFSESILFFQLENLLQVDKISSPCSFQTSIQIQEFFAKNNDPSFVNSLRSKNKFLHLLYRLLKAHKDLLNDENSELGHFIPAGC